ncbi:hypothetical protein [Salarchaeum japonicum]|uniref:Uncharacterized protein n=1 Tax=Salarchaeum japonicum TaxID=555573 RepID=A0AAV3SZR9_9EURY|nr:hypothetical protein [Salarchaeum japonicum]
MGDLDPAKLREALRAEDEVELPEWTGRVPAELARNLSWRARAWEKSGKDGSFAATARARDAIGITGSERTTKAIAAGNSSQVAFETGITDNDLDTGYVKSLAEFWKVLRYVGRIIVLTGGTNNGKTNVGFLGVDLTDRFVEDLLVVGNVPRDDISARWIDDYQEVESIDELEDVLEAEPERRKLVLVDDASLDHAEGTSNSHQVRERMGEITRLAAKRHAVMLFLAHREDGMGVAKHLREMPDSVQLHCQRVLDEDGHVEEYAAELRSGVGEDAETVRDLGNLPEADTEYHPDAVAHQLFGG